MQVYAAYGIDESENAGLPERQTVSTRERADDVLMKKVVLALPEFQRINFEKRVEGREMTAMV